MKKIRFKKDAMDLKFFKTLQKNVDQYFQSNRLNKTANRIARIKAVVLISLYLVAFISIFFAQSTALLYLSYALLGSLTIFVALNIAHDAAHHTFSEKKWVNNILLYTFDFLGASGYMWRLKHVHSHHPHVNIPDMDGDIKQTNIVRIFPNAKFFNFHKYQYLYMPFLYMLYTLIWLCFRDFKDYLDTNISGKQNVHHRPIEYVKLVLSKMMFIGRMIVLPTVLLPFSFWTVLFGFVIFHFSASITVAMALISAHIGEHSVYPEPDKDGVMPTSWVRHQMVTTSDFATDSKILTHLFGGFNHHVVHHLFPNICHIHYPKLTEILKATCKEFGMPYNSTPTLIDAMFSHLKFLKIRSVEGKKVPYIEM